MGMRYWLSFRGPFGTRPGVSIGPEDLRPYLPSWRRHEYREALKAYAAKHGQPITNAQANHDIDKALALGDLNAAGPVLRIRGSRQEIIDAVMEASQKFGIPMDGAIAGAMTDKAIRPSRWPAIAMAAILLAAVVWAAHADERLHDGAPCFNDYGEAGTYYSGHCYVDDGD